MAQAIVHQGYHGFLVRIFKLSGMLMAHFAKGVPMGLQPRIWAKMMAKLR